MEKRKFVKTSCPFTVGSAPDWELISAADKQPHRQVKHTAVQRSRVIVTLGFAVMERYPAGQKGKVASKL